MDAPSQKHEFRFWFWLNDKKICIYKSVWRLEMECRYKKLRVNALQNNKIPHASNIIFQAGTAKNLWYREVSNFDVKILAPDIKEPP